MKIKKNDKVKVISGKDKGKTGVVLRVERSKDRVLVEGINVAKKHLKPTQSNPDGGIVKQEAFIHVSNVALVIGKAKNEEITKIGYKTVDNKKVRYAKKTNEVLK